LIFCQLPGIPEFQGITIWVEKLKTRKYAPN
jgi:hypothetical protein